MKRMIVMMNLVVMLAVSAAVASAQEPQPPVRDGALRDWVGIVMNVVSEATGLDRAEIIRLSQEENQTLAQIITTNGGDVEAVKQQIISAIQADFNENLDERVDNVLNNPLPGRGVGRDGRPGGRGDGGPLANGVIAEIAEQAGLEIAAIREQAQSGAPLSEIATSAGLDPNAIMTAVKERAVERVNQRVADGEMTQEEADQVLADLDSRLAEVMNTPLPDLAQQARNTAAVARAVTKATTDTLGLQPDDLRDGLTEGQTLTDFITANGGDVNAVSAAAVQLLNEQIAQAVANGRMTQEEANELLAGVDVAVQEALSRPFEGRLRDGRR